MVPPLPQQKEYRQGTVIEKVLKYRLFICLCYNSSVGVIVGWWFRRGRTKEGLLMISTIPSSPTETTWPSDACHPSPITIISCQNIYYLTGRFYYYNKVLLFLISVLSAFQAHYQTTTFFFFFWWRKHIRTNTITPNFSSSLKWLILERVLLREGGGYQIYHLSCGTCLLLLPYYILGFHSTH